MRIVLWSALAVTLLLVAGVVVYGATRPEVYPDLPDSYYNDCHVWAPDTEPIGCIFGDSESDTTVVLFGDSHAGQWLPALERIADRRGWRLQNHSKSGCNPYGVRVANPTDLEHEYFACEQWRDAVMDDLRADPPDMVIMSAANRMYQTLGADDWLTGMTDTLLLFESIGTRPVLITDTPVPCGETVCVDAEYLADELAAVESTGAGLIISSEWVTAPDDFRDAHHLSVRFAASLADRLDAVL